MTTTRSWSIQQQRVFERIAGMGLARGARILDAPCGEGLLAAKLLAAGFDVAGVDVNEAAAATLGRSFAASDLERPLPFERQSFDALLCVEGIEHLENTFAFFREAHRVIRPGGRFVVTTPNITGIRSRVRYLGSGFYNQDKTPLREAGRNPLHHIGLRTFPDLRYALMTTGFRLVEVGHTHIKPASWLYLPWAPWMALYTAIAFRKEKDERQRAANIEIRHALTSTSLLLGENLLLVAERV